MSKKWYTITFLVILFLIPVLHVSGKDKDFSELENRTLAQSPSFNKEAVLDGSFGKEVECYMADQFPFRNQFLSVKLAAELIMGKTESNGVFLGKEGQLLQNFENPDLKLLEKNAGYMNALGKEVKTWFLLAPTATSIYKERLPLLASTYSEEQYINMTEELLSKDISFVDVQPILEEHKDEYIYYKTDHHWTTLGAFYAYERLCDKMGLEPKKLSDFTREQIEGFYGSLYSAGNVTFAKPDTLELFYPKEPVSVKIENMAEGSVSDSLYEKSYLEKKDKYSVFLNNNQPLLVIHSSVKNGKKLLIAKDSYANCLIPFLTAHFEEIHVLDLRYLNFSVKDYALQNGIEEVLLLYNVQSFAADTKLSLLQ
ncbi:DHHW family protein [Acetivibrio ethanolgignens]|uniref:AlgX/AlgJ SGNH hydrolase-like domain-containing protein n=1 Tax=Acetivibrio ethanolgignens TaxID=290052 RepID=A0A0V8QAK7_9FIRM|nr:DHHW family protein [Acetivibrio ethanolgignens]KSV57624.1 hypothetical protein ASU35_04225 [Acetivibrio ethanolgignens]